MYVDGNKIKVLVEAYGKEKGYPEKSYMAKFCEDFELNYNQWNAYSRGAQVIGTKIVQRLMEIFPDVDLNWLLKENEALEALSMVHEPKETLLKESEKMIMDKLEIIHKEILKLKK
ncbi:MAG: hypothetical protein J0M25_00820 [Flavobacteriales bacterium]|nr:hypothetical protein [Flavobacteriales bacterium]